MAELAGLVVVMAAVLLAVVHRAERARESTSWARQARRHAEEGAELEEAVAHLCPEDRQAVLRFAEYLRDGRGR
jgi:hypothetical protein